MFGRIFFLVIAILALAFIFFMNGGKKGNNYSETPPAALLEPSAGVGVTMSKVRYSGLSSGKTRWELFSDKAIMEKTSAVELNNVKFLYYDENGLTYTLAGKSAHYSEKDSLIDVKGNVFITSREGYRLFTDSITYAMDSHILSTDMPVRIISPKMELIGVGLNMNLKEERMNVLKDVRAVLKDAFI